MPYSTDVQDFSNVTGGKRTPDHVDPYLKIHPKSAETVVKLEELLKMVQDKQDFKPLCNTIKNSISLINLYTEWQEGVTPKGQKFYFNRKTKLTQNNKPVMTFTTKCSVGTTKDEVKFLLRMAEVIDAQDVLHSMRLMVYA